MRSATALSGRRLWSGFFPPLALSALVVGAMWVSLTSAPPLHAQSNSTHGHGPLATQSFADLDGDGLTVEQEQILGTSPTKADTDRDGFSDLEEVARKSSPTLSGSTPNLAQPLSVGMTASASTDGVHAVVAVYMSDTDLRNKHLTVGFFARGHVILLSASYLALHSTTSFHPSSNTNGCIGLIDVTIDPHIIHELGELSVFAAATMPSAPGMCNPSSGATLHFLSIGGVVVYCMPNPRPPSSAQSQCPSGQGQTSIYVPLIPNSPQSGGGTGGGAGGGSGGGGTAPGTWSAGEVCFQRSSPVAVNGAVVTNEVITANCVNGWDGFCPPSCTSTVGSTYQTIDPLVLIGG
jgi:hypothetical protein